MGNNIIRKFFTRINLTALLLLAAVFGAVFIMAQDAGVAYAAQKRVVKVGFFPMEGYHELSQSGSYTGMDVEYLENLCDYVNWEIVYVPCDSWDEALELLEAKEVDLVGSAQYSSERAEKFQYASLPSGYTFGAIAVEGDSLFAYEDFDAMQDITYGIVATYVRRQEFNEYLSDHQIISPKVREYEDTAALHKALADGEIEALVHSLTEVREGQRVIGRFAPMPFYYISYPGNDDVMRELNQGVADLKMNRPELENELMVKYYDSRLDQTVLLTSEEKQYIEEKGTLTVGYLDGYYPFSYEDENGEYQGLTVQVLEEVAVSTGMSFSYVKMVDMKEARKALWTGSIDIISYCDESPGFMKEEGIAMTKGYTQVPQVIIRKRSDKAEEITLLAVTNSGISGEGSQGFVDEFEQIMVLDSQEECLYAVESGEADAALCDGYLAEYLMGTRLSLGKLEIHSVLNDSRVVYMAVKEDQESPLLGILNKELLAVTDKMVNDYMLRDNFYARMSIESFISDHSIPIILILTGCAVLVILVLFNMLKNSRRIQKLMYKDTDFNIWNLNYLKYRASLKLTEDRVLKYAIVYTDICQFKSYNAIYGWHAGQRILELSIKEISAQIDSVKELYARSYGSHFVLFVCYENMDSLKRRMMDMADRISDRIYEQTGIRMAQAMGICAVEQKDTDIQLALSYAIQAVDPLKDSHSNAIQIYDDTLREQLRERHEREKLLDSVDFGKDFVAYYQAKVDIRNEQIVGAEALVRFKDPTDNGAIRAPGFFVPYYEQTGRITEIDFFVMESVCQMLHRRIDEGKRVVPVSCNFSRMHFVKDGFPEKFEAVINKYQVPKELIEVEITETLVVEEMQQQKVKENVAILRANGVRLSIDDFGSGYSSLGVFEQIPASVIKLDRSFLLNNENRTRQVQIMKNIVNLAKDLEAQVVCEGVETQNDTELMMEIGAYVAQGYRYCKPVPEREFEGMLT
ncbi:EAL domain-containing protein [bacterium 0.1xD8-71]|nr:EAL domain-containing protein [bacterium 0.1xD8-71]